jgi:hypothetical protein
MGRSMPCVLGPLAPFADGFRRALADRGYACEPVRKQMLLMAHVSRWLAGHGFGAGRANRHHSGAVPGCEARGGLLRSRVPAGDVTAAGLPT